MRKLLVLFLVVIPFLFNGQQVVENVVLITLDGLRWQEVYGGAVDSMMMNEILTKDKEEVLTRFSGKNRNDAREKLMPWFWTKIANEGQLYGNRWKGNKMTCTNRFRFSYPGYNEILTGYSDPEIDSNEKKYNQNTTILEWLHKKPEFAGKVAAFASWDVFPYIINDKRSGIPVNAGFSKAKDTYLTFTEQLLNDLQDQIPSPWSAVRLDAFTHNYMIEYMKKHHPRVIYISYGETDDFAHDGRYDNYLKSTHQTDQWIKALWKFIEADPYYAGNTSLVITTDHGRGTSPMTEWKGHGTTTLGSNEIWAAALGPNIPALGEVNSDDLLFQSQIAKTIAAILGYDYNGGKYEEGDVISTMINK
ncbi:MAG: alkaline phosphatase family protein [Saprospiraceae bacterium]|nr:alkaline phosphatase family protein [Saprospiraceae bacterium]